MALDNSTLGKAFWQETEANAPKKWAGQYEIIRDKFPLEASLKFVIDSNMVQIDNPSRLPDALLHSYIDGKGSLYFSPGTRRSIGLPCHPLQKRILF